MSSRDVRKALRTHPFKPFRMHISDGTFHDIRHPEIVIVSLDSVFVGKPPQKGQDADIEDFDWIDLNHVVRLEPLKAKKPA